MDRPVEQQSPNSSLEEPNVVRFIVGTAAFFGIAVGTALLVASDVVASGRPAWLAVAIGAYLGFFSAYFAFWSYYRLWKWVTRQKGNERV